MSHSKQPSPHRKTSNEVIRFPEMLHQGGSIGYIEKMIIGQMLMISQPNLIVETGSLYGQTTRFLAEFIELNELPRCRIASFDLPEVVSSIRESDPFFESHSEIEFVAGKLPESLQNFLASISGFVDFAIIDAEHSYRAVKEELLLVHSRLKPGGYIFCHDYRELDPNPDYQGVVRAANEFGNNYGYDLLPLNSSQWQEAEVVWGAALLRKPFQPRSFWKSLFRRL